MHWTISLEGGPRRVNHAAVAVGDKVYSFGGYCSGEDYSIARNIDIHVLKTATYRWRKLENDQNCPDVPFQRYGHTVVAVDNKIYLWGGRSDECGCTQLYIFDTETERWSMPTVTGHIPEARDGHTACMIGRFMYIFAGYLEFSLSYTQDVHILDVDNLRWRRYDHTTGVPPSFRDFHTSLGYNDKMYIWGGREVPRGIYFNEELEEYGSDMYVLDIVCGHWEKLICSGDIPIGRRSHSSVMYGNKMLVFGGYNRKKCTHYNDLHQFDPSTNTWMEILPIGEGPCARRRQVCCIVGSKMFLFGGTSRRPDYHSIRSGVDIDDDQDLIDHNDLHVLDIAPSLKTLALLQVIKLKIVPPWLPPELKFMMEAMTLPNSISRPLNHTG